MNIVVFLNTDLTSRITETSVQFDEALMLVDEPNSVGAPTPLPLLNCGNTGAPDNGVSGPGVCSIVSNGNPTQTYDGSQNTYGTSACEIGAAQPPNSYGCGRPNVFQGRVLPPASPGPANAVEFFGVPFDPPGAGTRIFRITNLRGDPALLGTPGAQILATVAINGSLMVNISPAVVTLSTAVPGLIATVPSPTPDVSTVHVVEGFSNAWEAKNLSMAVGNGIPGNAMGPTFPYTYITPNQNYPADVAQNVPGINDYSESMFEWLNNGPNGPPSPNPALGYAPGSVPNIGNPLFWSGFGLFDPGVMNSGVADSGTRIALTFSHVNGKDTVTVPPFIYLHAVSGSPSINTGVMVLTATDVAGAGTFTPTTNASIPAGNFAVYEVLYANPTQIEYADIPCTLVHSGKGKGGGNSVTVSVGFAPSYPFGATPAPTAIPRFVPATASITLF